MSFVNKFLKNPFENNQYFKFTLTSVSSCAFFFLTVAYVFSSICLSYFYSNYYNFKTKLL